MSQKLISIIIPVYNNEKYLKKCIQSIINQTYKKIEIILINDGSTDNSLEICNAFYKNDSRIKVLDQINGGLSAARNTGINNATGEFFMFVDGDDFVSENFCEAAISNQRKLNSDIVIFNYKNIYQDKIELYSQNVSEGIVPKDKAMELIINDSHAWNKLYKANLFKGIRYPVGRNYEDILTTYKLIDKSKKISYVNKSTYYYVHREKIGISASRSSKNVEDLFFANVKRFNFYKNKYPNAASKAEKSLISFAFIFLVYRDQKTDSNLVDIAKKILKNRKLIKKLDIKHRIAIYMYQCLPKIVFYKIIKK